MVWPVSAPTLLWFRQDLRLPDNAAYAAALGRGSAVVPVYIHAPDEEGDWAPGGASRWWLHHALEDLTAALEGVGLRLVIRRGGSLKALRRLAKETGAAAVYWNRRYEPEVTRRDAGVKEALANDGLEAKSFNSSLLFEPWTVRTGQGKAYKVYTPFSRTVMAKGFADPVETRAKRPAAPAEWPESMEVSDLGLLPEIPWDEGIRKAWTPTRRGGLRRLNDFLDGPVRDYADARDIPAEDGTSRLSPYLHFGQVGPREAVARALSGNPGKGRETFVRELVWREFAYHVLYHFPDTPRQPLQDAFRRFPWRTDKAALRAWQQGRTGYPIVDAGMRQLWETGWMHNRVRMVVASFLVKHLLLPWQAGACWFWDTLVDADLASNTLGWQWAGGCGADAAPYFRIFNPMTQGSKFDGGGDYVRRFVPELAELPAKHIHTPWEAPPDVLRRAGVRLGDTYPEPIVDHREGRERALGALAKVRDGG